jgi:hypothetical protein
MKTFEEWIGEFHPRLSTYSMPQKYQYESDMKACWLACASEHSKTLEDMGKRLEIAIEALEDIERYSNEKDTKKDAGAALKAIEPDDTGNGGVE